MVKELTHHQEAARKHGMYAIDYRGPDAVVDPQQVKRLTDSSRLCLAGGVALNCVANGRILREGPFEDIWIQPAAGDAGR